MWIDDKVNLTCPDLICVVEKATGYPITNPNCVEGMEVAVLGFHCHELWTRERALEILNPRFFGFDMACVFLQDCSHKPATNSYDLGNEFVPK